MQLAQRLEVAPQTVNRWIRGATVPRAKPLQKILALLDSEPTFIKLQLVSDKGVPLKYGSQFLWPLVAQIFSQLINWHFLSLLKPSRKIVERHIHRVAELL